MTPEEEKQIRVNLVHGSYAGTPKEYRVFEMLLAEIDRLRQQVEELATDSRLFIPGVWACDRRMLEIKVHVDLIERPDMTDERLSSNRHWPIVKRSKEGL